MSFVMRRGGGTRVRTGGGGGCACRVGSSGECCATGACGCRKAGTGCSSDCACARRRAKAPFCRDGEPCVARTSNKEGTRGRRFFSCARPRAEQCGFFEWIGDEQGVCSNPLTHQKDAAGPLLADAKQTRGAGANVRGLVSAIGLVVQCRVQPGLPAAEYHLVEAHVLVVVCLVLSKPLPDVKFVAVLLLKGRQWICTWLNMSVAGRGGNESVGYGEAGEEAAPRREKRRREDSSGFPKATSSVIILD
ncbi:MAG: hypothetical protein SGPRY_009735 [Prymnesium sp.]